VTGAARNLAFTGIAETPADPTVIYGSAEAPREHRPALSGNPVMLVRSLVFVGVVSALIIATATDAEARRFRLFSSSARAATPTVPAAKPDAIAPKPVAPADRSGTFVYVGSGRGAAATSAPQGEEPALRRGEAMPMLATITDPARRPRQRKTSRAAHPSCVSRRCRHRCGASRS
jgi:hypothetical protein